MLVLTEDEETERHGNNKKKDKKDARGKEMRMSEINAHGREKSRGVVKEKTASGKQGQKWKGGGARETGAE